MELCLGPSGSSSDEPLRERAAWLGRPAAALGNAQEGHQAQPFEVRSLLLPPSCPTPRSRSRTSGDSSPIPWPAIRAALRCGSAES